MRYIRTKDGRTICFTKFLRSGDKIVEYDCSREIPILDTTNGDKTADTIEELCDEYVIYAEDCKPCKYFLSQGHKEDILANPNIDLREYLKTRSIYGAIWTDEGLIYVAKMNDKGEFELL